MRMTAPIRSGVETGCNSPRDGERESTFSPSPKNIRRANRGQRFPARACPSWIGCFPGRKANQQRKSSSAGLCSAAWWSFPNRPIAHASSKMPMFLTLKSPRRICVSLTGLMKTSEPAGIRRMHRDRKDSSAHIPCFRNSGNVEVCL